MMLDEQEGTLGGFHYHPIRNRAFPFGFKSWTDQSVWGNTYGQ